MKKFAPLLMLLVLVPVQASALNTTDILSIVAMPLAVDAVSRASGVPQDQLAQFVSTLNQANVPPEQFVQTVRYAPVALNQSDFVPWVDTQTSQGINGPDLVTVIDQRLPQYGVDVQPYNVTPTSVLSDTFIPAIASALASGDTRSLLSLVAMPLAVAAVAELAGVPQDQLATLLGSLNQANVPPAQFVQTVRYVPVALLEQPTFVPWVQTQVANGVNGPALVTAINQQWPTYTPRPSSSTLIVDDTDVPREIRTRVSDWQAHPHPHGGPPGQIKKMIGVQTGAEAMGRETRSVEAPRTAFIPPGQLKKEERRAERENEVHGNGDGHGNGHGHGKQREDAPVVFAPPPPVAPAPVIVQPQEDDHGHGRGPGGQGPPGQQKEKGGKGHGKD